MVAPGPLKPTTFFIAYLDGPLKMGVQKATVLDSSGRVPGASEKAVTLTGTWQGPLMSQQAAYPSSCGQATAQA